MSPLHNPLIVRPSEDEDISQLTSIYAHSVLHGTGTFEIDPPSQDDMTLRRNALVQAGYPYLVALWDNEIAGFAYAGPYRLRAAYKATVEDSVYISHLYQGRGIGRALMDALIDRCRSRHFSQMLAVIGDSANQGSIRLHQACGFHHVGTFEKVGYKHEKWLDTVLMQKDLQKNS